VLDGFATERYPSATLPFNGKDTMVKLVGNQKSSRSMEIPKSRVHVFRGQDLAEPVLDWLRHKDRTDDDPVERLVRLELKRSREFFPGIGTTDDPSPQIKALVQDITHRWQLGFVLGVDLVLNDWTVSWKTEPIEGVPLTARQAFRNCLFLKQQGLLDRVRQCTRPGCKEWFFAKFDHQHSHSDECRVAMLSTDEARKEERKKYMRDLRAKKKVKKFRSQKKGGK
jgi:hypothetical protein